MFKKLKAELKAHQSFNAEANASLAEHHFESAAAGMAAPDAGEMDEMRNIALQNHYARMNASAKRIGIDSEKMTVASLIAVVLRRK